MLRTKVWQTEGQTKRRLYALSLWGAYKKKKKKKKKKAVASPLKPCLICWFLMFICSSISYWQPCVDLNCTSVQMLQEQITWSKIPTSETNRYIFYKILIVNCTVPRFFFICPQFVLEGRGSWAPGPQNWNFWLEHCTNWSIWPILNHRLSEQMFVLILR